MNTEEPPLSPTSDKKRTPLAAVISGAAGHVLRPIPARREKVEVSVRKKKRGKASLLNVNLAICLEFSTADVAGGWR